MHSFYSDIVSLPLFSPPQSIVKEKGREYSWLTERHLHVLWWEQNFLKELTSHDGLPIRILSPGHWNAGSGPDFLKAHLVIGLREWRGDVEIHLSDEGWKRHGHSSDPAYNKVVLHVSFWENKTNHPLFTSEGREISRLYLHDKLTLSPDKIVRLIDTDLYPSKPCIGTGKCSSAVFNRLNVEEAQAFFSSAASWRLLKKGEQILSLTHSPEESCIAGLARSLGFPLNTQSFLRMFQILFPLRKEGSPELIQALALGMCGFLEEGKYSEWNENTLYSSLKFIWNKFSKSFEKISLAPQRTRPLHHPVRRIAALSHLLCDEQLLDLIPKARQLWDSHSTYLSQPKHRHKLWHELLDLCPSYDDDYWNSHYFFETVRQTQYLPLIGGQMKKEMILNVLLPILYSHFSLKDSELMPQFLKALSGSGSSRASYLKSRFYGDRQQGKLFKLALVEQGAMQLHHDFCQHFETSCIGCPFIERFEQKILPNRISCN